MRVSSLPLTLLFAVCAATLACAALMPLQIDDDSFSAQSDSHDIERRSSSAFLLSQPLELRASDDVIESQWLDASAASASPTSFDAAAVDRDRDSRSPVVICKQSESRVLKARGAGIENVQTDKAEIRAVVEEHRDITDSSVKGAALRKIASEVQRAVAARSSDVVDYLQHDRSISKKISKLRTSAISLHPEYSWQNQTRRLTGYFASTTLTFHVQASDAGAVLDSIVQKGVSIIDRLRFFTSPSVLEAARKRALTSALRDALSQARAIVTELQSSAPESLSPHDSKTDNLRVLKIEVTQLSQPMGRDIAMQTRSYRRVMEPEASVPNMPIVPEEQQVSAAIVVKIGY